MVASADVPNCSMMPPDTASWRHRRSMRCLGRPGSWCLMRRWEESVRKCRHGAELRPSPGSEAMG